MFEQSRIRQELKAYFLNFLRTVKANFIKSLYALLYLQLFNEKKTKDIIPFNGLLMELVWKICTIMIFLSISVLKLE